ncbi:MAG: spondin domain-containing protein [Bacteroidota bacterium]
MRIAALLLALVALPAWAQSEASYSVTFASTWSAATHPDGFPGNPHFSGLVGATHNSGTTLWEVGGKATAGIESMAETGSKSALLTEVNALVGSGAGAALSGGGIGLSPGNVALTFSATESHAYVSLVSMLAPSPDWFVGVNGLALRDANGWIAEITVPLFVYDSGTDSGPAYTSANQDTDPAEDIFRIEDAPFKVGDAVVPVGTFTFTLQNVTANEEAPSQLELSNPTPNPASSFTTLTLTRPDAAPMTVEVFDAMGRRVSMPDAAGEPGRQLVQIDTSTWAPGVYHVRVTTPTEVSTRRFVVQR